MSAWLSTMYPYQRRWLDEDNRVAVSIKARQIGMSHASAAWAVMMAVFTGAPVCVVSIGEREALEVIEKAQKHCAVLMGLGSRWARTHVAMKQVHTLSGGKIAALPASSGARGYSGHVVLDEFAYHGSDAEHVWDAAGASTTHGFAIRVLSTPSGVGTVFHSLVVNAGRMGYALHRTTLEDAITDGLVVDRQHCRRMARGDERVYATLFECAFTDGGEQYLRTADVERARVDDDELRCDGDCYAGLDVGLEHDLSVLTVIRQDRYTDEVRLVDLVPMRRTAWSEQMGAIEESLSRWGWRKLAVDATGLGAVPAELLQQRYGEHRVDAVRFSSSTKEELASTLYQVFADGLIKIPMGDDALVQDLVSIQRVITPAGVVRYDAPRTSECHADRAWSLALALRACAGRPVARVVGGEAYA